MRSKKPAGSIPLSILLSVCVLLSGLFFIHSFVARQALQPAEIRTEMNKAGLQQRVISKVENLKFGSVSMKGKAQELVDSPEFDALFDRYAQSISDYLLKGSSKDPVTEQQLENLFITFAKDQAASLSLPEAEVNEAIRKAVENANLDQLFRPAEMLIPPPANLLMQFALNTVSCYVSLALAAVFLILLLFAARPRRFALFTGLTLALAGAGTMAVSKLAADLFNDLFSDQTVSNLIAHYSEMVEPLGVVLLAVGGVLFVAGVVIALVTRRRHDWWDRRA